MKTFLLFVLFMAITALSIVLAIILGDSGAWYFAWLLGTGLIVLVTASGAMLLDTQDELRRAASQTDVDSHNKSD